MPSPSIRVVVVDDTEDIRFLTRLALQQDPDFLVVGEAGDGHEALDVVGRERPDLVLLDLAMPLMDGMQALPRLRALSPESAVVVMSAFEAHAMASETTELGAVGYVQKGEPMMELAGTLRRLLTAAGKVVRGSD